MHRTRRTDARTAVRWGLLAAAALTPVAGYLFQHTARQARWEALLAATAAGLAIYFRQSVRRGQQASSGDAPTARLGAAACVAVAAATALVVVRQTMEIAVVAGAALEMRSLEADTAIASSVVIALAAAFAYVSLNRRASDRACAAATVACASVFFIQAVIYTFHESAEAGFLPWSEMLHTASEPYGPDGIYGRNVSYLLLLAPLVAAATANLRFRTERRPRRWSGWMVARPLQALAVVGILCSLGGVIALRAQNARASVAVSSASTAFSASPALSATSAPAAAVPMTMAGKNVLYRHTAGNAVGGMLTIAALEPPGARPVSVPFVCDRVSFAAGNGICLQTERGVFTNYKAVLFDADMKPRRSIKLDGSPSRTRVSADGRLGAVTVFVTGRAHGYSSASFSTRTTLIDMTSGDELTDLEQFTTWRDGAKVHAADYNFWGVTFAHDSNTFYATLKTDGKTFLVRGDLGLRKLTILHENVECPSLSPNNTLIAYKKRTGPDLAPWRIYVIDLATMAERPIAAETRSVDDQLEWLDDAHVLYGMRRSSQSDLSDVWVSPIDGSSGARVFLPEAESPIIVGR
jgi:hypothetical protein